MKLKPEANCSKCPKLCCYSLARPDVGFSHRSKRPNMCRYCDIISEKGCKIHAILDSTSRHCDAYTCYGVGNHLADIFGLDPHEKASSSVQYTFRQRQGIAHYLWCVKEFLKAHSRKRNLQKFREFVHVWEMSIFDSHPTHDIRITDFISALNTLMQECNVGYDTSNHQFCLLNWE